MHIRSRKQKARTDSKANLTKRVLIEEFVMIGPMIVMMLQNLNLVSIDCSWCYKFYDLSKLLAY
jgi:hypothetical protein